MLVIGNLLTCFKNRIYLEVYLNCFFHSDFTHSMHLELARDYQWLPTQYPLVRVPHRNLKYLQGRRIIARLEDGWSILLMCMWHASILISKLNFKVLFTPIVYIHHCSSISVESWVILHHPSTLICYVNTYLVPWINCFFTTLRCVDSRLFCCYLFQNSR